MSELSSTTRSSILAEPGAGVNGPRAAGEGSLSSPDEKEAALKVLPGATFECVRCGSRFSGEELAKLPELTCSNCGYRIFRKVRGPVAKTLKSE